MRGSSIRLTLRRLNDGMRISTSIRLLGLHLRIMMIFLQVGREHEVVTGAFVLLVSWKILEPYFF